MINEKLKKIKITILKLITFPKQYAKGILSHVLLMFVCLHLQIDSQPITGLKVFMEYSHE